MKKTRGIVSSQVQTNKRPDQLKVFDPSITQNLFNVIKKFLS